MVKYYEANGAILKFKDDKLTFAFSSYTNIKDFYLVEEDGIFDGQEVHQGEAIVTFYDKDERGHCKYTILGADTFFAAKLKEGQEKYQKEIARREELSVNDCCEKEQAY